MKKILLSLALILPTLTHAVLPPLYSTLDEFKSLVNDERLPKALDSGEAIIDIRKSSDDSFLITTNKHTLKIKIIRDPQKLMGPSKFHLDFPSAATPIGGSAS